MHNIVKTLINECGDFIKEDEQKWCFHNHWAGGSSVLCTGEFTSFGEGGGKFEFKKVKKGGITCERCIEIIKTYKSVKL